jgi:hypothetical protein
LTRSARAPASFKLSLKPARFRFLAGAAPRPQSRTSSSPKHPKQSGLALVRQIKKQKRLEKKHIPNAEPIRPTHAAPKSASGDRAEFLAWCKLWGKMSLYFERYPA